MTTEELERLEKGQALRYDISAYKNKVSSIHDIIDHRFIGKERIDACGEFIDVDLIIEMFNKQIERHEQKIADLQKQFDEL